MNSMVALDVNSGPPSLDISLGNPNLEKNSRRLKSIHANQHVKFRWRLKIYLTTLTAYYEKVVPGKVEKNQQIFFKKGL